MTQYLRHFFCAFEATSFEDAIRNVISIGSDSATIATTAGRVAEARFGVPEELKISATVFLPRGILQVFNPIIG